MTKIARKESRKRNFQFSQLVCRSMKSATGVWTFYVHTNILLSRSLALSNSQQYLTSRHTALYRARSVAKRLPIRDKLSRSHSAEFSRKLFHHKVATFGLFAREPIISPLNPVACRPSRISDLNLFLFPSDVWIESRDSICLEIL